MAVKRYPVQYVRVYKYKPGNGEEEDIVFMANGNLFPLFKSYTGVELTTALDDYRKALLRDAVTPDAARLISRYTEAATPEAKEKVISENPELIISMMRTALNASEITEGLSLIDALLICSHVCALPEADYAEALGLGTELLPQEIYDDVSFAFEILQLASGYTEHVKKNSKLVRDAARRN